MPKKRATRAQTKHAKPVLDSSPEDHMIAEMARAEKEAKLKNFIQDFKLNGKLVV